MLGVEEAEEPAQAVAAAGDARFDTVVAVDVVADAAAVGVIVSEKGHGNELG